MREPIPKPPKRERRKVNRLKQRGKVAKNWSQTRNEYMAKRPADHTGYWICDLCHRYTEHPEVDHIKPRSTHPELRYEESNLRLLCVPCHRALSGITFAP